MDNFSSYLLMFCCSLGVRGLATEFKIFFHFSEIFLISYPMSNVMLGTRDTMVNQREQHVILQERKEVLRN